MLPNFHSTLIILIAFAWTTSQGLDSTEKGQSAEPQLRGFEGELDVAAASDSATLLSGTSHKVVASGWPSTTQMWPSIQTASTRSNQSTGWMQMVEPFIFADQPRPTDYSLLLSLNKTVLEILKAQIKPMGVNLSFEYYFDLDRKVTALPGIKIEVDRKQFMYLEPNEAQTVKPRIWMSFNERITITDPMQLDKPDWLKFALVNRQSPSLVAIRRLQVEFRMGDGSNSKPTQDNRSPNQNESPLREQTVPVGQPAAPNAPPQPPAVTYQEPLAQPPSLGPSYPPRNEAPLAPEQPSRPQQLTEPPSVPDNAPPNQAPEAEGPDGGYVPQQPQYPPVATQPDVYPEGDQYSAPSDIHTATSPAVDFSSKGKDKETKEKHKVSDKNKDASGSWWGRRRRKRDTDLAKEVRGQQVANDSIVLTCLTSNQCDWKADGSEQIQWALARMPPATKMVQSGYFYVSNQNNYGDMRSMLNLHLNQTDSATIADQNSDHCLELALYITEGTHLKLYKLSRVSDMSPWSRGNLLMTWTPTTTTPKRGRLPGAQLAAMENEQNGWTFESLCYGDFFIDPKECGAGLCAFGFEMEPDAHKAPSGRARGEKLYETSAESELVVHGEGSGEQVVGVALLKEYSVNVAQKADKPRWLETWLREKVEPSDNWKFYPKQDYRVSSNNISLVNLYDDSRYFIASDWLHVSNHLELQAILAIELEAGNETMANLSSLHNSLIESMNSIGNEDSAVGLGPNGDICVFSLRLTTKLVDTNYDIISSNSSTIDWSLKNNGSLFNLGLSVTDEIKAARHGQLKGQDTSLFKIVFEFVLDTRWLAPNSTLERFFLGNSNNLNYKISLANVSLSDRCSPNPCQFGSCRQNGTDYEDWQCTCEDKYRGRRCEFGRWCNLPHITPWTPPPQLASSQQKSAKNQVVGVQPQRQAKGLGDSVIRVSGKEYCQRKLGLGFRCTDIDLPLNDQLYTEEDRTFICSCQDDYFLSDDSKCKQAHLCNSIVCPSIGMVCDESRPFNRTQPCQCDEKQDWYLDSRIEPNQPPRCTRRQCRDKARDCGFDAHICLPTLPGERPICKCGPKFALKTNPETGQKYCQSTACVLPTLNDCQQICLPDNSNLQRPYTCACHPGYTLDPVDGRTCTPQRPHMPAYCRPACNSETQICTDLGCRCKQGYIGEGEVRIQQAVRNRVVGNSTTPTIEYTQSIKCLNVCALTYAENKEEFEMIESVCPLGLCNSSDFKCKCSDPSSSALINTKYEPINSAVASAQNESSRDSPLCQLRRVCEVNSSSYKVCKSQGAICVPDYTKAAMFDCICPPSTEKRLYGQQTSSEFTCEPKCSAKKSDCLAHQAVCKLVDKDEVRCECLPGFMFSQHYQKCFLAKYSYSFNLLIVNRYYEPESRFHHQIQMMNSTLQPSTLYDKNNRHSELDNRPLSELVPQLQNQPQPNGDSSASLFIAEYNQCNITQVIPKSVIEDPYEHNIESYLSYIDQCNEKIHQNVKTYHLNSRLSEDLRQSLRQHLRDFTVATNQSECLETDQSGMYLNCTIYLQSNEPVQKSIIDFIFNDCDKNAQDDKFCWIKPRLLLKQLDVASRSANHQNDELIMTNTTTRSIGDLNFKQIIPCELNNFCGLDAYSMRIDDKTSLCSCKCPIDIEVIDVRDLEPRQQLLHDDNPTGKISIKEVCAPRNNCGVNSTFCLGKTGSVCHYDIRLGSRCQCVYPSYEDSSGKCVEVTFSTLDNTFIVIIVLLGTALIVSIAINLTVVAKSQSLFGRSKQYPLNEFRTTASTHNNPRHHNRSTGVPNPVFTND